MSITQDRVRTYWDLDAASTTAPPHMPLPGPGADGCDPRPAC
jgi:hypothetical protein